MDDNGTPSGSGVNFTIHFDDLSANVFGVACGQGADSPGRKDDGFVSDILGPSSSNKSSRDFLNVYESQFVRSLGSLSFTTRLQSRTLTRSTQLARYEFYDGAIREPIH